MVTKRPYKGRNEEFALANRMRAEGSGLKVISLELGVPLKTIHNWTRNATTAKIVSANKSRPGPRPSRRTPLNEILVEGSTFNRYWLKRRLFEGEVLEDVCSGCGQEPFWNGKLLVLQLEHINGVHNDNRIENLCLLCPNCHTQTSTFAGRNNRKRT